MVSEVLVHGLYFQAETPWQRAGQWKALFLVSAMKQRAGRTREKGRD